MASIRKREWTTTAGEVKTAWIADYFDQTGKRHIKTCKSKREADRWLVEVRHEVARGIHTPARSSPTVLKAGEAWIDQADRDGLERSTTREYRRHLTMHIGPFLGATKLADLSPASVEALRDNLHNKGCSADMIGRVVGSLGMILGSAMSRGQIARNVVRDIGRKRHARLAKRHEKKLELGVDYPTKDEIRAMLAAVQGRWRPLVITAVFTGLRASELRGLRWSDVDLEGAALQVRQRADRWNVMGSPKSATSQREVPLAPMVVNALKEWRLACPKGPLDLVFPNSKGKVMALGSIHYRGLVPLQQATGCLNADGAPKYSMHSLRHVAASLFIEQNFLPKRVQALMGHSTIQMTFDTYGHLFPHDDDQEAMRQLQARLIG